MRASHAAWIAVLLPLLTAPWWFARGTVATWWGVPVWGVYSLAATAALAVTIAAWMGRWWERLADEADAAQATSHSQGDAPS
ncbi:MAG: hypothetical protein RIC55_07905 [Pirellulaceae bacterium]